MCFGDLRKRRGCGVDVVYQFGQKALSSLARVAASIQVVTRLIFYSSRCEEGAAQYYAILCDCFY